MRSADRVLEQSRQLALEQAALVGLAGSARPLEKGEDLKSARVAEADHWVAVYSELVDFSRELLTEMVGQGPKAGAGASDDAPTARLALEIQLELHQLHLGYWWRRRAQLQVNDTDDGG